MTKGLPVRIQILAGLAELQLGKAPNPQIASASLLVRLNPEDKFCCSLLTVFVKKSFTFLFLSLNIHDVELSDRFLIFEGQAVKLHSSIISTIMPLVLLYYYSTICLWHHF